MNDLISTVDWSRWQFALTAIYHWLFVPLTLGLSVIVAVMETIYMRHRDEVWKRATKFWMTLFGINFAIGVATGIILEFEFGTNWSNYSWFVGDIFGAPLAIEGLLAFFLEATFGAVMFFGWGRVSPRFHLVATWLTAIGASISALWILVANAWMQLPVGMTFDPEQMRNVMTDFWALFSPVAVNKFLHTTLSGWALAGVFVIGVSAWLLYRGRHADMAVRSIKTGGWIGLAGLLLTLYTGDGSAVEVARSQPMKLAAMEGLYNGHRGEGLVTAGIVNPNKTWANAEDEYLFDISIPTGLSILARHDPQAFVPGINDILAGRDFTPQGDTVNTVSYAERIRLGRLAHIALGDYDKARQRGDTAVMRTARAQLMDNFQYFGYGYFTQPHQAIPPVGVTFYSFRIMVGLGMYFLLFYIVVLVLVYRRKGRPTPLPRWLLWVSIVSIPLMWVCSEAGWVVAEVGRQPWTIQNLLPTVAAVSDVPPSSVITTFWIFAVLFTVLLVAEVSIMVRYINRDA